MALDLSQRGQVDPFIVMDVMRRANEREAQGKEVVHLEVGQPSTKAPEGILAAAQSCLDTDRVGYTDALGIPALRERIAQHYQDYYDVALDPGQVVVTTGSSTGFLLSFLASFETGAKIGLPTPGYPAYRNILKGLGFEPVDIAVDETSGFHPTPEHLKNLSVPLDGLIVASPNNPTGSMLSRDELAALCDYCAEAGIRFISDEIYHGITFERRADTALSFSDSAIIVNSFSKYFSMTGWRLGWLVVPKNMVRTIERLAQNFFISAPTLSQYAGVAAFDCLDQADDYVAAYARNRALLLQELPKMGLDRLAPSDGAFYLYVDVSHLGRDSQDLCQDILDTVGVAITPGLDFDPARGHNFIRLSYARSYSDMERACALLKEYFAS